MQPLKKALGNTKQVAQRHLDAVPEGLMLHGSACWPAPINYNPLSPQQHPASAVQLEPGAGILRPSGEVRGGLAQRQHIQQHRKEKGRTIDIHGTQEKHTHPDRADDCGLSRGVGWRTYASSSEGAHAVMWGMPRVRVATFQSALLLPSAQPGKANRSKETGRGGKKKLTPVH
ncbi:hypothetical protein SRHO_G00109500 [Serrasalmus rhombeus]